MTIPKEDLFWMHDVDAANVTPAGRFVLCRVERVERRGSEIWIPRSTEQSADGLGFIVHGTVVKVGVGAWEPAWVIGSTPPPPHGSNKPSIRVRDGQQAERPKQRAFSIMPDGTVQEQPVCAPGRLVFQPVTQVRVGAKVLFAVGWGPKAELRDGVYFFVHEDGLIGHLVHDHVHDWRLRISWDDEDGAREALDAVVLEAICRGSGVCTENAEGVVRERGRMEELFSDPYGFRLNALAESFDPQTIRIEDAPDPGSFDVVRLGADDDAPVTRDGIAAEAREAARIAEARALARLEGRDVIA